MNVRTSFVIDSLTFSSGSVSIYSASWPQIQPHRTWLPLRVCVNQQEKSECWFELQRKAYRREKSLMVPQINMSLTFQKVYAQWMSPTSLSRIYSHLTLGLTQSPENTKGFMSSLISGSKAQVHTMSLLLLGSISERTYFIASYTYKQRNRFISLNLCKKV